MGLRTAMYSGISGLTSHSEAMSVIGNNLANSSTMGFKRSSVNFEDVFYTTITTGAASSSQIGHGSSIASIYGDFSQGAYESTSSSTDLAISGNGFFMVANPTTGETYYTRAGNFEFDSDGYLIDPNGYILQGWTADTSSSSGTTGTTGSIGDIQLDSLVSEPQATENLTVVCNLDADSEDNTTSTTDPYFALLQAWDGTADNPLSADAYAYQNTITVYDEAGNSHDVSVYYDKVSNADGSTSWEYIVTCDPSDDGRTIGGVDVSTTSSAGLLMAGTITFNSSGEVTNMSAFTPSSNSSLPLDDLSNWTQAELSSEGLPLFTANFTGQSNASFTSSENAVNISLDLGISSSTASWSGGVANASLVGTNLNNLPELSDAILGGTSTTSYGASSSTLLQSQDGYTSGYLEDVSVSSSGVISGVYSNGQTMDLFILSLANFQNLQGLDREGDNLYSSTQSSGEPTIGQAGVAGLGTIASGYLEQSNVDTATEMVTMINIQRGFQANSKVITTVDTMLSEVIQLKR